MGLTAAHCTAGESARKLRVLLGEHNIADAEFNRVDVAEIIDDPNYDSSSTNSDFAILLVQASTPEKSPQLLAGEPSSAAATGPPCCRRSMSPSPPTSSVTSAIMVKSRT